MAADTLPSTPNPDPTLLTTSALYRAISDLRELIGTRIDGMDKAIVLLQTAADRAPAQVRETVGQLQELHQEKFSSIALQFEERDTRTEQASAAVKIAVDAALQAQKEAVGEQNKSNALAIAKTEASFTKNIDQIALLIQTGAKAVDDKIDDIKSRVQAMEGAKRGGTELWGYIVGAIGTIAAIVGIMALFFSVAHPGTLAQ